MTTLIQPPITLESTHLFQSHPPESSVSIDMEGPDERADRLPNTNNTTESQTLPDQLADPPPFETHEIQPIPYHARDLDMEGGEDTAGVSPSPWDSTTFDPGFDALARSATPHHHQATATTIPATTTPDDVPPPALTEVSQHTTSPHHVFPFIHERSDNEMPVSQETDPGHIDGDDSAEDDGGDDDDDDEEDSGSHMMHFYPFEEDLTPPTDDEMRVINTSTENSALDDKHWRDQTFLSIRDPEILPGESGVIEWTVESFNGTKDNPRKDLLVRSPTVRIGNHDWRIKLIPRGQIHTDRVSVYVECASVLTPSHVEWPEEQLPLPTIGNTKLLKRQAVTAQISVLMYNPEEPRVNEFRVGKHQFQQDSPDHGWPRFTNVAWHEIHRRSYMARQPLLRHDRLALKAYIRIVHDPTGCLWVHDDINSSPDSVATTGLQNLPAFDDLALGSVIALLIYLRPFRRILYLLGAHDLVAQPTSLPSNPLTMLQAILHRMRSRIQEHSDSRSRTQIHEYVDYVYDNEQDSYDVLQTMNCLISGIEKQLHTLSEGNGPIVSAARMAVGELSNLLGSRELQFSGSRKTRLSITNKKCVQEVVDAAKEDLAQLGTPQLLTLELARQVFDEKKRCWKKLRTKVKLEDEISVNGLTYTLYGFAAHAGYLQHGRYVSLFRPNGLGNLWYTYKSGRPECLTMASALASNEGSTNPSDSEEPISTHDHPTTYGGFGNGSAQSESHAYVVLYLRNDVASDSFYMPSAEPWDVPEWILDDHKPPSPADSTNDGRSTSKKVPPNAAGPQDGDTEMGDELVASSESVGNAAANNTAEADNGDGITVHTVIDYLSQPFYNGQVKDEEYHGHGHLIYLNGDEYIGNFDQGHRQGEGTMLYQNGDTYKGAWLDDKHEGQGEYTEKRTGNVYKGTFKDGKKYGEGTTFWKVSEEQSRLCQICYFQEANVAFYPCGHVVACSGCARRVEDCPICRRKIDTVLKLYYMA